MSSMQKGVLGVKIAENGCSQNTRYSSLRPMFGLLVPPQVVLTEAAQCAEYVDVSLI